MAVWPSDLPLLRDGFTESPVDRVIRSNMEIGPAKIRRRSTNAIRPASVKMFLTDAQLTTFDTFFNTNDALAFTFTNPRTSVAETARFVNTPSYVLDDTMWRVTVNLELMP